MIRPELLRAYLARQRSYAASGPTESVEVTYSQVERSDRPSLVRLLVEADGATYQVVVGLRPLEQQPDFLRGHD